MMKIRKKKLYQYYQKVYKN